MDAGLILSLKSEYGEIYSVSFGDQEYVYRSLTIGETKMIDLYCQYNDLDEIDREELYLKEAVVYPQDIDIDRMKPGHVTQLATAIADISGVGDYNVVINLLHTERENMEQDVIMKMKAWVMTAMPFWTEDALDQLTIKRFIRTVVLAEEMLTIQQEINGIPTEGARIQLYEVGAEEEAPVSKQEKITKEKLLKRINKEESDFGELRGKTFADQQRVNALDEELLIKAAGVAPSDDPIARKLREAMGG